jgi:mannose-6-phosphate isomerase-like protein (cupin superfamily)
MIFTEERPWGKFERFTLNQRSTVKLIYVDSDKRLSLQYHNKRTEFWKVLKGPVIAQVGERVSIMEPGDTVMIKPKTVHRLEGGGTDAVVLEISFGKFEEDDIVRLQDDYKRIALA